MQNFHTYKPTYFSSNYLKNSFFKKLKGSKDTKASFPSNRERKSSLLPSSNQGCYEANNESERGGESTVQRIENEAASTQVCRAPR